MNRRGRSAPELRPHDAVIGSTIFIPRDEVMVLPDHLFYRMRSEQCLEFADKTDEAKPVASDRQDQEKWR